MSDIYSKNAEEQPKYLNAHLPRKVRLYSDDAQKLFWVVAALLGTGILYFGAYSIFTAKQMHQRNALRREGRTIAAEISAVNSNRSGIFIDYTYTVGGRDYQGVAKLPDDRRVYADVGEQITIRYLPDDPFTSHPADWEWSMGWDIVLHLVVLFITALGIWGAIKIFDDRNLARNGWVVEGRVTSCVPKGLRFSVDYDFQTEDECRVEGANDYADEYEVGSRILVIYMRKKPSRNSPYPLDSYRTVIR